MAEEMVPINLDNANVVNGVELQRLYDTLSKQRDLQVWVTWSKTVPEGDTAVCIYYTVGDRDLPPRYLLARDRN